MGIVGRETKAFLNNSGRKFKRSKLERQLNRDIIWCILILIILCATGAIGSFVWLHSLPGDNILFLLSEVSSNIPLSAFINFLTFVIIFQAVIPLPLYLTIEGVKMVILFFMNNDIELYDPMRNKRIEVHAFNIPEDLGQIEYVFCDKTGTLTKNKMIFKRAVINGIDYCADEEIPMEMLDGDTDHQTIVTSIRLSTVREFIPFVPPTPTASFNPIQQNCFGRATSHSSPSLGCLTPLSEEELPTPQPPLPPHPFDGQTDTERRNCQRVQDFFLCLTICNSCVVSANKNVTDPLVQPRKRNPLLRLRRGMRSKWSPDDSGPLSSSSRFRRLFIRGSRDELYEVGEDALQTENDASNATNLDKSIHKSLSISSLFGRQRRVEGETSENDGHHSGRPHIRRHLAILTESPTHGEGKSNFKNRFKPIGKPPANVNRISDSAATGDNEPRKFKLK
ncbi:unnamed protein product [Hymenolepis diminuta]|uniref:P-type phospholipid transporter n=1 Tax=Hymenolepis diminuta TaxID=6216 RepID=A0A0R3SJ46_HYMDI|nr:unnamed protein product [Hymenolepis diminuta]